MNRIKELRASRNIKQADLAATIKVSQAALSGYETGKFQADIETYMKIAAYFDVSLDYLLGRTDKKEKPTPEEGGRQDDEALEQEFIRRFRAQSPERQKEVLFELAKTVAERGE